MVLDDSRLAFVPDTERPPPDSLTLFTYYVRSYRAFVESRDGEGVRHALSLAQGYTTTSEQENYASNEMDWSYGTITISRTGWPTTACKPCFPPTLPERDRDWPS